MKNTAVNLLVAIFLVIISATAAKAQASQQQSDMFRNELNNTRLGAGESIIIADEFAGFSASDPRVYRKWVNKYTKMIKLEDSVIFATVTLGEQRGDAVEMYTVNDTLMPFRSFRLYKMRDAKLHKGEDIPMFTFDPKAPERPIMIVSYKLNGDKDKAISKLSQEAIASTNSEPKTEPKSVQAEEGGEEDQDRSGTSLTGIAPENLELVQMITESVQRQEAKLGVTAWTCKLGSVEVNNILLDQSTKRDTLALRLETLDTATFRSLSTKRDTVLYGQPTFYTLKGTCGHKMYFHTFINNGPHVFQGMPTESKDEESTASETEGGSDELGAKAPDTEGSDKAPAKTDKGSTSTSDSTATADTGKIKSAEEDTLGGKFRHEVLGNPGRNAFVLFDPKNAQAIFNPDPKWGYYFNPETGLTTPLGSKFFKRQFRLAKRGAFDPFGYAAFGDEYAPVYPSYGYGYSNNYGLMGGGGWDYGYGGCFGGYNSYRGGIYGTTFAMDYNSGCTGFLHSGPMWARRQCYGLNYDPCTSCNTYYNDVNVSVGAGAGIWVGAGAGTGYRNASAGDGDAASEALVVRYDDGGMQKMVDDAKAKAKAADSNKGMQSMVDRAKFNDLSAGMQQQMAQFKQQEQAKENHAMQNLVNAAREQNQATASNQVVNREREASKTPKPMDIRPTAAASSNTSVRENTNGNATGIRPAGTQSAGHGNSAARENSASADRGNYNVRPQTQGSVKPARESHTTQVAPARDRGNHHLPQQMQPKPQRGENNHTVRPHVQRPSSKPSVQQSRPQQRPAQVQGKRPGGNSRPTVMRGKGRTGGQMRQGKR